MTQLYPPEAEFQGKNAAPGCPVTDGKGQGVSPSPLPCLYSNNSIETSADGAERIAEEVLPALASALSPYHKKQAHLLFSKVHRLCNHVAPSINNVGMLTLTFPDNVTDNKEASRRWDSLNSNFLSKHPEFLAWILTKERQWRGAWHYHIVIETRGDIRTGVDFEELAAGRYTSASPYLRKLWKDLREAMERYNFGRSELLPVKTNAEAMGRYVGKYISKHLGTRKEEDKGVRLISSSKGLGGGCMRFAWLNHNSREWRRKLYLFAQYHGCSEMYQLQEKLGPRWAYKYAEDIMDIERILLHGDGVVHSEYGSGTIKRITENRKNREAAEKKQLNIIKRKSERQKAKEAAKEKVQNAMGRYKLDADRSRPDLGAVPMTGDEITNSLLRIERRQVAEQRERDELKQYLGGRIETREPDQKEIPF